MSEEPASARESTGQESPRREGGLYAVGGAVARIAAPIVRRRGGGLLVRLKAEWANIVGAEWGEASWPIALSRDGALKLRVASAVALELQHRAPLFVERINGHFGRTVVSRLVLRQGPLPLPSELGGPRPRPLSAREETALEERLSHVADPELRAALARLGRAVAGSRE
ncbi:MAG TPA: DciA family protein [Stellaceae bacterium]|nr:DciA family protein [Stellaceae bacterium]